jgi:hypothetical protein
MFASWHFRQQQQSSISVATTEMHLLLIGTRQLFEIKKFFSENYQYLNTVLFKIYFWINNKNKFLIFPSSNNCFPKLHLIFYHVIFNNIYTSLKSLIFNFKYILPSVKIGQHLESVTILECAVTWVQMSMMSFILQTASRNR